MLLVKHFRSLWGKVKKMANWFPKYSGSPLDKMFSGLLGEDNGDVDPYSSVSWMEEETKRALLGDKYFSPKRSSPLGLGEYPEGKDPNEAFGFLVGDMPEANVDPDIIEKNKGKDELIKKLSDALTKIGEDDKVRGPDAYGPKLSGINPRVGPSRGRGGRQVTYDPTNVLTTPELTKYTMDRSIASREGFPQFLGLLNSGWTSPMDMSTAFRAPRPVFTSSSWNASNLFS